MCNAKLSAASFCSVAKNIDTGIPHGGTSQSKLLGAYKLHVNGRVVGMGPGRRINQTQGVDAIDVTKIMQPGANTIGIQG